jgi:hypothetical protein
MVIASNTHDTIIEQIYFFISKSSFLSLQDFLAAMAAVFFFYVFVRALERKPIEAAA